MDFLLGRYRNLTILVGVLFLQVLGLAVQVKRTGDGDGTRLIRIWAVDAVTPFEKLFVWSESGGRNLWRNYFYLRGVRAENRDLKAQIEKMRLEQVRLSEDAEQARRLQQLLGFRETVIASTVAAQVIGSSASDLSRSIYIDKGSNDKIAPDMAVITAGGVVGKVLRVYPSTALVLLINDQSSGVGAMLEKSRLQGVLRGTAEGAVVMERVMSDEQVSPGEAVATSGGDQIFPKGLPVGTVTEVKPGREMFLSIHVKPSADLNRLEEVLVVTEKQEQNPVADAGGRMRAADILAERLPSVPEKPVPAAGEATSNPPASASAAGAQAPASSNGAAILKPTAMPGDPTMKPPAERGTGREAAPSTAQPNATSPRMSSPSMSAPGVTSPKLTTPLKTAPPQPRATQPKAPAAPPAAQPPATDSD
jgi:rod shape-determining protein MreC